jgi:hypothetical protein
MTPINPLPPVITARSRISFWYIVLFAFLAVLLLGGVGVARCFVLGSDTAALRQSVMGSVPGTWDRKITARVGLLTTSLVRVAAHFFKLPPEPSAALGALHGAEVGIYKLKQEPGWADSAAILAHADKAMLARGWDRIVAVGKEDKLVAAYFPHRASSARGVKCCLFVLQGRDLVVVSARGNVEPLLDLVTKQLNRESPQLTLVHLR